MPQSATRPRPNDKLAAALDLARYGFNVFPIRPYVDPGPRASPEAIILAEKEAKKPIIENWQNLATNDETRVTAWWRQHPDANIGICTNGLLVIDVDPWKGGKATFADLAAEGKLTGDDFPPTLAAGTQSGGSHIFYWLPERTTAKGGVNKLGPGIDVKAHGGYVVAAGSTIGDKAYAWKQGYAPDKRDFAQAPQWLIDRCNAPRQKSADAGKVIILEDEIAIRHARDWLKDNAPHARIGERGFTAFKVACRFYDYGVSKETCEELLIDWSEEYCEAPMDREDIEHAAYSALKNRDNAIGAKHPDAPGFEPYEMPTNATPAPAAPKALRGVYRIPYMLAADKALEQNTKPLIEGIIDQQAMSVWYGESNSGKTFVMLDAAWHVAAGRDWAGRATQKGAVGYVAAEGGVGILKRIRALRERYPDAGAVPFFIIPCPVDLLHPDADLKALVAEVKAIAAEAGIPVALVVVDTLSRAIAGGNENDSQDMGRFVANLDALRTATGAHIAVVHHTGKDKAKGARGHSLLRAATDTEIEIDQRTLTVTKQRDMEGNTSFQFALKPVRLGVTRAGNEVSSCTVDMRYGGERGEPVPLQPRLLELLEEIDAKLADENPDNSDTPIPFGWELAGACLQSIYLRHSSGKVVKRQTVQDMLTEMTEKCWLDKVGRNQWVSRFAGNAGNAGN